jgi:hypothetical protein
MAVKFGLFVPQGWKMDQDGELRHLRLTDRDGIGMGWGMQPGERVAHLPPVVQDEDPGSTRA